MQSSRELAKRVSELVDEYASAGYLVQASRSDLKLIKRIGANHCAFYGVDAGFFDSSANNVLFLGACEVLARSQRQTTSGQITHHAASGYLVQLTAPFTPAGRRDLAWMLNHRRAVERPEIDRLKIHTLSHDITQFVLTDQDMQAHLRSVLGVPIDASRLPFEIVVVDVKSRCELEGDRTSRVAEVSLEFQATTGYFVYGGGAHVIRGYEPSEPSTVLLTRAVAERLRERDLTSSLAAVLRHEVTHVFRKLAMGHPDEIGMALDERLADVAADQDSYLDLAAFFDGVSTLMPPGRRMADQLRAVLRSDQPADDFYVGLASVIGARHTAWLSTFSPPGNSLQLSVLSPSAEGFRSSLGERQREVYGEAALEAWATDHQSWSSGISR
jgi:hypothetical protein